MENIPAAVAARYAILRFAKVKTQAHFDQIDAELDRELPAVLHGDGTCSRNWDESRSYLNRDLLDTPVEEQMKSTYRRVRERIGDQKIRKNAVLGVEIFMGFSPGMREHIDIDDWAREQIAWVRKTFGANSLLKAVLHMDEATPHIQVVIVPFCGKTKSGLPKLNCRGLLGDRGDKKTCRPGQLEKLQDSYAATNRRFGLERGVKGAPAEHISLKQMRREDRKAGAFAKNLLKEIKEEFEIPLLEKGILESTGAWMERQKKAIAEALAHRGRLIDEAARHLCAFAESTLKHARTQRKLDAAVEALVSEKDASSMMSKNLARLLEEKEKARAALAGKVIAQESEIEQLRRLLFASNRRGSQLDLHQARGLEKT